MKMHQFTQMNATSLDAQKSRRVDGLLKADIGGLAMTIGKNESVTTDFTKGGNDKIQTPDNLAMKVVAHFCDQMTGRILEPCCGEGAFVRALKSVLLPTLGKPTIPASMIPRRPLRE